MKFCIEFAYYSATLYFRATHYLCILWWPKQLQDFKSLCPIGRGQGFYHPGDGETAKEVWEERRLVLHHLVLRRWEQHWHSHHYQAGQALILCAQNYLCSGLYALRVIFAMSCKIQWVHVYLWIKSLHDVMRVCSSLFILPGIFSSSCNFDSGSSCFTQWWKNDNPSRCKSYGVSISHLWG